MRPNQVSQTDITYIPVANRFMYLTAVIDVFSRRILGWNLSNNMEAELCRDIIAETVLIYGAPEIINTDQGSQCTSEFFTDYIIKLYLSKLSMDGKGLATNNAYIERFWWSIKYEHIYLNPSNDVLQLYRGINGYN